MSHYDNIGFTGITDSQSLVDTVKRVAPQAQEIAVFMPTATRAARSCG